jgi:tetratricopeptide (TPR) repeat protein
VTKPDRARETAVEIKRGAQPKVDSDATRRAVRAEQTTSGTRDRQILTQPVATQKWPVQVNDALSEARQARQRGEGVEAIQALDRAGKIARDLRDREAEAGVALEKAQTLQRFGRSKVDPEWKNETVQSYSRALVVGSPVQKTAARNNLGAFWLQEKNYDKAISTLSEVDPGTIPPAQQAAYRYNLGRAHELNQQTGPAWKQYWQAWKVNPDFHKPVEGCFRLALSMNPPKLKELAELATNLVHRGQSELALPYLREGLTNFPENSSAPLVLQALVAAYAATALTPPAFAATDRPMLVNLSQRSPSLNSHLTELVQAFDGPLPASFLEYDVRRAFPTWTASGAKNVMSDLLKSVGDFYARSNDDTNAAVGQALQALARYSCAWILNPAHTEAALYAAALLSDNKALDPNGSRLAQFTEILFELKGGSYRVRYKTEEDWLNIMRAHLVLGTIYERSQTWGNEGDVRSAIFQLSRARAAEHQILKLNPSFSPSPRLYARLANAYEQATRQKDALGLYVQAAEGFLHYDDRPSASNAVVRARSLTVAKAPEDLARLRKVEDALK